MLNQGVAGYSAAPRQNGITLWHCSQCQAFITVRSAYVLNEAFCPACVEMPLEFCGSLSCIPELQFGEA